MLRRFIKLSPGVEMEWVVIVWRTVPPDNSPYRDTFASSI